MVQLGYRAEGERGREERERYTLFDRREAVGLVKAWGGWESGHARTTTVGRRRSSTGVERRRVAGVARVSRCMVIVCQEANIHTSGRNDGNHHGHGLFRRKQPTPNDNVNDIPRRRRS